MKYFLTKGSIYVTPKFKEKYSIPKDISQFDIVCKAKSKAEANRKAEAVGLGKNFFSSGFVSETSNQDQVNTADKYEIVIGYSGRGIQINTDIREAIFD
ncbi:hypothetical protein [Brevibacillus laterosporus]|uniref:hypothetical protein n=1 Tax=Brevibacillus laterosporus TaxID=1465 RepID=UPI0018F8B481|nr:hypothetical protein [Brevibacillus laterosporus]MBG9776169.1 hypothetical protein [Brevibacillus laterosporus]MED1665744.1 hypothetical protein [Brevibacillus laterosporus]MED1667167.1 hypothetical protein [Brevibacillus laterosporus]MED1719765.1 hypothetical protein [Brevibacillus laterosporus]